MAGNDSLRPVCGWRWALRLTCVHMDEGEWGTAGEVKRAQVYAGPVGLLLLLLLFLVLPAATASCSTDSASVSVSATGADVVVGGDPDFETSGELKLSAEAEAKEASTAAPHGVVRVLGIAAVAVMGLGLLVAFVRVWRLRALVTGAVAATAAVLLAITEFALVNQWTRLAEDTAAWLVYLPEAEGIDVVGRAGEVVGTGWGFWLTLAGLVLIVAVNGFLLLEGRARLEPTPDEP